MHELTLYRQKRNDGGIRTGVESREDSPESAGPSSSSTVLIDFQEGPPGLRDVPLGSSLLWYLDLRCRGDDLPTEPEAVRRWFLDLEPVIVAGLRSMVGELGLGPDDAEPIRWDRFRGVPAGLRIELVMSAVRRVAWEEMSRAIVDLADHYGRYVGGLAPADVLSA